MSLANPERLVTKQDLKDFYDGILPYLGGNAAAGFTPIGTIIAVYAESAPANYLACDGAAYNKSDYPELAAHLLALTDHSAYEVSGDNTKFKVPDLRGEFLRGTGTNGHSNCGDGESVGTHQDPTALPYIFRNGSNGQLGMSSNASGALYSPNGDNFYMAGTGACKWTIATGTASQGPGTDWDTMTVRPTNTSVLFCIATKNIYLNPAMDYSTEEKVVGTWIDGKPIYQKTIYIASLPNASTERYDHNISNFGRLVEMNGTYKFSSGSYASLVVTNPISSEQMINTACTSTQISITTGTDRSSMEGYITLRYTKTTD